MCPSQGHNIQVVGVVFILGAPHPGGRGCTYLGGQYPGGRGWGVIHSRCTTSMWRGMRGTTYPGNGECVHRSGANIQAARAVSMSVGNIQVTKVSIPAAPLTGGVVSIPGEQFPSGGGCISPRSTLSKWGSPSQSGYIQVTGGWWSIPGESPV